MIIKCFNCGNYVESLLKRDKNNVNQVILFCPICKNELGFKDFGDNTDYEKLRNTSKIQRKEVKDNG